MFRVFLLAFLLSPVALVNGLTALWVPTLSGNWFDITNWLLGGLNAVPVGNNDAVVSLVGTYTVTVDQNLALAGALTLGSDTLGGAHATLSIATGITAVYTALNIQAGGVIHVLDNAELHVTALTITSPNVTISGNGKLFVNGSLIYAQNAGVAWINVPYQATSLQVTNGAKVYITSTGSCSGGSINLGASGQGGELVIQGAWSIGNCSTTGGGGNLTFWGQTSSSQWFTVQGNHNVLYLKVGDQAALNVSGLTLTGSLWVGGSGASATVNANSTITGDVWVVATGTSNFAVNALWLGISGQLALGLDGSTSVNPTLALASWAVVNVAALNVHTGGNIALASNSQLWATSVTFTGSSHSVGASGSGDSGNLTVTGALTYSYWGGTVVVSAPFNTSGTITVNNGSRLQITGSGWCNGGAINLGATGQGGELEIKGNWNHGNCLPQGGGGNFTLNSQTVVNYALAQGTYAVWYLKAAGSARVWVAASVVVSGTLWVGGSAQVIVNETAAVQQDFIATENGVLEVKGATVTVARATFGASTSYIIHATSSTPQKLTATGAAVFNGLVRVIAAGIKVAGGVNVTITTYGSHNGTFNNVDVQEDASASASSSRRLLSTGYSVEYDQNQAYVYGHNGVSALAPSMLLVGLIMSLLVGLLN